MPSLSNTTRLVTTDAATLAAVGLSAGAVLAAGSIESNPNPASPGSTVTVNTTGCGTAAKNTDGDSTAGGEFQLALGTHTGLLVGQFKVPAGTKAGSYGVGVICPNGTKIQSTFRVTAASPVGPVKTGLGGGTSTGDTTEIAAGLALAAAAVAGGVYLRRRTTGDSIRPRSTVPWRVRAMAGDPTRHAVRSRRSEPHRGRWRAASYGCELNGGSTLLDDYLMSVGMRPSKAIAKAFNGAFQRVVQRLRPLPVGSSDISAM